MTQVFILVQYQILQEKKSSLKFIVSKKQLQMEDLPKWKKNVLQFGTKNISFIHLHQHQQVFKYKRTWRCVLDKWLLLFNFVFILGCSRYSCSSGLVVKSLDSWSRGPVFKTTGWLQGWLSLSSFRGRQNQYQEYLGT